ncbi:hypothetical protein BDFB_007060 [Asbolus verrucosus]|uniref:Uncharacterized protein n=1 Tax=Asbolus verrucosus TaxID=1661398 RepID=A0A482VRV9_ASBVE|nr:hypothetical protein BDFB_007060 [Asbolus verrucosus]
MKSPAANRLRGRSGGAGGGLPQDEWTDEMRWCCSAISHQSGPGGPQWAAPAPCPAWPADSGPDLSVQNASRRVCPPTDSRRQPAPVGTPPARRMTALLDSGRAVFDALATIHGMGGPGGKNNAWMKLMGIVHKERRHHDSGATSTDRTLSQ